MKILNLFFLTLILLLTACGDNNGSTNVGNPDGNVTTGQKIQMGKLVDGKSAITIPLGIFGTDEEDIGNALIDVKVNGALRHNDIKAASYFNPSKNAVTFMLSSLKHQDRVTFLMALDGGSLKTFEGQVSDAEDTEAVDLDAEEDNGEVPPALQAIEGVYRCSTNCRELIFCMNDIVPNYQLEENLQNIQHRIRLDTYFGSVEGRNLVAMSDIDDPSSQEEDEFAPNAQNIAYFDLDASEWGPDAEDIYCRNGECDYMRVQFQFKPTEFSVTNSWFPIISGGQNRVCPVAKFRKISN